MYIYKYSHASLINLIVLSIIPFLSAAKNEDFENVKSVPQTVNL